MIGCSSDTVTSTTLSTPPPSNDVLNTVDSWPQHKSIFFKNMNQLTEIERLQVVRRILHDPQSPNTPDLCRSLQQKHHQTYCVSLLNRAHLWEVAIPKETAVDNSPNDRLFTVEECPQQDAWCITKVALNYGSALMIMKASQTCTAISNTRSREECFFQIAEHIVNKDNSTYFAKAFDICRQASSFQNHCQSHLIEQLARSNSSNSSLVQLLTEIEQQSALFPTDPVDYFYSQRALYFPNDDTLPLKHLHSVQTYQFLREQPKSTQSLQNWIDQFREYKQKFSQFAPIKVDGHIQNYWIGIKAHKTYYLSIEKRPTSEDHTLDLKLAMIAGLVEFRFPLDTIREEYSTGPIHQMLSKVNKPQDTNKR